MNTSKAIPELSVDTQLLERRMLAANVGDVIPYDELSAVIGRDVQTDARGNLTSARNRVLRSSQMVFEPVTNVGLKRLDDHGIVSLGSSYAGRIRNLARRGRRKLAAVLNFDALPNTLKVEHNTRYAQLSAIGHFASEKSTKKIEGAVTDTAASLPLRHCLDKMKDVL